LVGFTLKQEQLLIQKLIYKELYREDVLMWMDLWEKERMKYEETYAAFKWQTDYISKQEAVLNHCNELKEKSELINKELIEELKKSSKTNIRLTRIVSIGIPAGIIVGGVLGAALSK